MRTTKQQPSSHPQDKQKALPSQLSFGQRSLATELHYLQQFILTYPKTTQTKFLPYLEFLKTQHGFSQGLKQRIAKVQKRIGDRKELGSSFKEANNLLGIFKLMNGENSGVHRLLEYFEKVGEKVKALETDHEQRSKYVKKHGVEYYPDRIDKTDSLSKQFEMSYRLSKMFGTHNLSHHDRKAKDPQFEVVPRLIFRLQEISHYQTSSEHLGNILMLTYEGTKITGNKGYAVIDNNKIQWWQKRANGPPEISLVVENDQDAKQGTQKIVTQDQPQQLPPTNNKENRSNDQKFKLQQVFLGHTDKITSISISYDELYMLSTGMDKCIKLWCLRFKTQLAEFYGHVGTIWDVQWGPTGYYFLTGGADKLAILWKTDVPAPQRIFEHQGEVYKVNFLKNPDFVCTAGEQGVFRIWKIMSGECIRQISFPSQILNFQLSFSGAYMGLYQTTGQISIYDISKGQKINSFRILQGQHTTTFNTTKRQKPMKPHDIAFSQNEKELVVITAKHIMLYSMDNLAEKQPRNIYQIQQENSQKKTQPPKEVIYVGRDVNLTYCKYTRKNLLVVAGTRKVVN